MRSIELLVIFTVATLHLAVVARCVGTDELVADAELFQFQLKEGRFIGAFWQEAVGKLSAVVGLDTFNEIRELFHNMAQKNGGGIGAVLLKSLYIPESAVLIQEGILKPLRRLLLVHNTSLRNEFHIDLNTLAGILHLFVGFGNILGVWRFYRHSAAFPQETVQPGNGPGIASLPELDPQHNDPGAWVAAAHVQDELNFFRRVLVWVMMWPARAVCQRLERTVIPLAPTVDVLPVQPVTNGCRCNAVLVGILNYCLPKAHGLCYPVHGE